MGLGAAAGALLVALGVLGAPPGAGAELSALEVLLGVLGGTAELCAALTGVFLEMLKFECYFINGTEKVRYVERYIYNRVQDVMFDSDVGHFVGFTPFGERNAKHWNSNPAKMEDIRAAVDTYCRHNYEVSRPFITERRVPPSVSISLVPASSSQPGPGRLLCSVMDFYPAAIQVRWFQGQQELSEHVVATDVVANGDWTYQLLVLLETPPRRGLSYSCQVEHVSLEQPLRRHWGTEMPPDAGRSKMLTGIGGLVLGSVFLALGLGFYVRKKVRAGAGGGVAAVAEPRGGGGGRDGGRAGERRRSRDSEEPENREEEEKEDEQHHQNPAASTPTAEPQPPPAPSASPPPHIPHCRAEPVADRPPEEGWMRTREGSLPADAAVPRCGNSSVRGSCSIRRGRIGAR
ncbi:class II histocompatibility antigen, B-L beta chain-like [Melospiza melodia melodia]